MGGSAGDRTRGGCCAPASAGTHGRAAFGRRSRRRPPASGHRHPPASPCGTLGGLTALAFAGLVVAALAAPSGPVTRGAADGASPTPAARAIPSPTPQPAGVKSNDKGKGKGDHGGDGGD